MNEKFLKPYDPKNTEARIYQLWIESGFFNPDNLPGSRKKTFTIVIPPPNITGSLHMGHALNNIIQDILIRKKRMEGYKALWLPGTDHAGIATQNVVEKQLKKEGKTRHDLGREKFIKKVWEWKNKYGDIILNQLRGLGCSCDWSRTRFTMDEGYVKAVETAFLHYYKKGWIYQGDRVVNWCPRCQTSLSDLELEYKESPGKLWYLKYPFKDGSGFITVATTRPETMLGDAAVAVNPKDTRYKNLVGKTVILPIVKREIPIITDRLIEMGFGTGAVKVTPGHDINDFEISERHKLPIYNIINKYGRMTAETGKDYENLKVLEAREKVVAELEKQGLIEKIEDYQVRLAKCYRCNSVIEPQVSKQWFVKMYKLAEMAKAAVKNGKVKFHPKKWEKVYFNWLNNIKDWCISRQIWWGHKIPARQCLIKMPPDKKMGFHESVVPQVFNGKISTWRLRDHNFKPGDIVAFENSQTGEIFGYGTITKVVKTTVGEIDLKDKSHYKTYKNRRELIKAFKRHNPDYEVNENTPVFAYTYTFRKITATDGGCGRIIISEAKPKKCPNCGSTDIVSIPDVLDTWFSSALWPFATLGYPDKTNDLKTYYPTQTLSTARDIINLWVSRMIFSGMEFMKEKPFSDVFIHPTVLNKEGKRMSKSLGTGVDPLDLIEKYGADATRFGLIYQMLGNQDMHFGEEPLLAGKKFINKLWNITRFVLTKTNDKIINLSKPKAIKDKETKKILGKLDKIINQVDKDIENYKFGHALHLIYDFTWHDFADKYLEYSKDKKEGGYEQALAYILITIIKLLHPFIPFATEEIWDAINKDKKKGLLIIKKWPK